MLMLKLTAPSSLSWHFIFFSSLLLPYRISQAYSHRVCKLLQWPVALNIAAVKVYGLQYLLSF